MTIGEEHVLDTVGYMKALGKERAFLPLSYCVLILVSHLCSWSVLAHIAGLLVMFHESNKS